LCGGKENFEILQEIESETKKTLGIRHQDDILMPVQMRENGQTDPSLEVSISYPFCRMAKKIRAEIFDECEDYKFQSFFK
jgi:hypothetical protein